MKKSLLIAGLLAAVSSAVPQAGADIIYNAATGFSGTQGANGWSYAAVHFPGVGNLAGNQLLGTYDAPNSRWRMDFGGGVILDITATQQDMLEGNAYFSLRYWTAGANYPLATVTSTLSATVTVGAWIGYVAAATPSVTTNLSGTYFSTLGGIAAGGGTEVIPINLALTNVQAGDRIYFVMQNSGDGQGSFTMQTWDQNVTVPEPAALSLLALGGLVLARRRR